MIVHTYQVRTVADFFDVPADKRAACLEDFATWLEVVGMITREAAANADVVTDVFSWTDDGRHDFSLRVSASDPPPEQPA